MSEFRQDPLTGEWVIVAPGRTRRPGGWRAGRKHEPVPRHSADCPFCPGNEDRLPGIEREWKSAEASEWAVRAVPNLFPAVGAAGQAPRAGRGGAFEGIHEVLVEGPRHDLDLADFPIAELSRLLSAYRERFCELATRPGVRAVALFRNRGAEAGASLRHPHAQILALPTVPPRLAAWESRSREAHERTGSCPTCTSLADELEQRVRVVAEHRAFVALVPSAALGPFEQLIVPRRHAASFADLSPDGVGELAVALSQALCRIRDLLDDPPYNFLFETGPGDAEPAPFLHWRLRIVPRLTVTGGFERLAGMAINPSSPEEDAGLLRGAKAGWAGSK